MAWAGYFQFAGQEVINVQRTETYAAHAGWFRPLYKATDLDRLFNETYVTPLVDDAPWIDPDAPESEEFWGVYPLDVTGIEDSTRTSVVVENIRDGGTPGRLRHATKAMVFNVILVGASECGVNYGMNWLKTVLLGSACGTDVTRTCNGDDLCYLDCEPCLPENFRATVAVPSEIINEDVPTDGDWLVVGGTWNGTTYN